MNNEDNYNRVLRLDGSNSYFIVNPLLWMTPPTFNDDEAKSYGSIVEKNIYLYILNEKFVAIDKKIEIKFNLN
jgi:hypothetical protein